MDDHDENDIDDDVTIEDTSETRQANLEAANTSIIHFDQTRKHPQDLQLWCSRLHCQEATEHPFRGANTGSVVPQIAICGNKYCQGYSCIECGQIFEVRGIANDLLNPDEEEIDLAQLDPFTGAYPSHVCQEDDKFLEGYPRMKRCICCHKLNLMPITGCRRLRCIDCHANIGICPRQSVSFDIDPNQPSTSQSYDDMEMPCPCTMDTSVLFVSVPAEESAVMDVDEEPDTSHQHETVPELSNDVQETQIWHEPPNKEEEAQGRGAEGILSPIEEPEIVFGQRHSEQSNQNLIPPPQIIEPSDNPNLTHPDQSIYNGHQTPVQSSIKAQPLPSEPPTDQPTSNAQNQGGGQNQNEEGQSQNEGSQSSQVRNQRSPPTPITKHSAAIISQSSPESGQGSYDDALNLPNIHTPEA